MPRGRMLNKKIIQDEKVAKLSLEATLLYTWCIPFLDIKGRMYGDLWTLKAIVPNIDTITLRKLPRIIQEWINADLVIYYGNDKQKYLEFKGFTKNQNLQIDREAPSEIPSSLKSNSSVTPELLTANTIQYNISKDNAVVFPFDKIWEKYPNPVGKKDAIRHFNASVKTEQDWKDVNQALKNYTASDKVKKGFIMNGSTFFNNWQDYVNYKNPGPGAVKETKEKYDPNCRQKCNKGWHIVVKDGVSGYRKCSCWRDR